MIIQNRYRLIENKSLLEFKTAMWDLKLSPNLIVPWIKIKVQVLDAQLFKYEVVFFNGGVYL